jgi:hypothetical protein
MNLDGDMDNRPLYDRPNLSIKSILFEHEDNLSPHAQIGDNANSQIHNSVACMADYE